MGYATWEASAVGRSNREFQYYNVYLDDELAGTTTDLFWQYDNLVNGQTHVAAVSAQYDEGMSDIVTFEFIYEGTGASNNLVSVTELKGNYPNPFNPTTTIGFSINDPGRVTLTIYNMKGQMVKTLVDANMVRDNHTVIWNGTDNNNSKVTSGIYFYKMITERYTSTKKMILMK